MLRFNINYLNFVKEFKIKIAINSYSTLTITIKKTVVTIEVFEVATKINFINLLPNCYPKIHYN